MNTPVNTTVADNMASGRCILPQLPVTTAPVHDLESESCHSAQHLEERSGDDLLPSVSAVTSEISGGPKFRPVNSQPLSVSSGQPTTFFIIYCYTSSSTFYCYQSAHPIFVSSISNSDHWCWASSYHYFHSNLYIGWNI